MKQTFALFAAAGLLMASTPAAFAAPLGLADGVGVADQGAPPEEPPPPPPPPPPDPF